MGIGGVDQKILAFLGDQEDQFGGKILRKVERSGKCC